MVGKTDLNKGFNIFSEIIKIFKKGKITKSRDVAYFELSNICNAKCIFCPYPLIYKQKKLGYMSDEIFYKSLERAYELGYTKLNFTPTTGELLLHEKWHEFIQHTLNDKRTESVYFYSNAILLNDDAADKIISFQNPEKIFAIFFSVGGVDTDSYELMYGVDKFATVCANINNLCEKLAKHNSNIKINCELRMPKHIRPDIKQMRLLLNQVCYKNFNLSYINNYDNIGGMIGSKYLKYLPEKAKSAPCYRLNDIRFDIHGDVWACGCVVTEQGNNSDLIIGNTDNDPSLLAAKHTAILSNWNTKSIPNVCEQCKLYKAT